MGGVYYLATHTLGLPRFMENKSLQDSVFVSGMAYAVPGRDSAIVVLVDTVSTGTNSPRVVDAATIENNLAPTAAAKRWTSGDTTFIVRPRVRDDLLPASILEHPMVREFLARAP